MTQMSNIKKDCAFIEVTKIDPDFKWRDKHGIFVSPSRMGTEYLYNTLVMIFNHGVKGKWRTWTLPVKKPTVSLKRKFPAFYTHEYMASAFQQIYNNLKRRTMTESQQYVVSHMEDMLHCRHRSK